MLWFLSVSESRQERNLLYLSNSRGWEKYQQGRTMPERVELNRKSGIIPLCPVCFSVTEDIQKIRHPSFFH